MSFKEIDFSKMTDEEIDEFYRPRKMNNRKSLAPLFVYLILKDESNQEKHLSQSDIIRSLEEYPFEITIERKALSRILHSLHDSGLGVISTEKGGSWFDEDETWMDIAC